MKSKCLTLTAIIINLSCVHSLNTDKQFERKVRRTFVNNNLSIEPQMRGKV